MLHIIWTKNLLQSILETIKSVALSVMKRIISRSVIKEFFYSKKRYKVRKNGDMTYIRFMRGSGTVLENPTQFCRQLTFKIFISSLMYICIMYIYRLSKVHSVLKYCNDLFISKVKILTATSNCFRDAFMTCERWHKV